MLRGLWLSLLLASGCMRDALVPCGDLVCPTDAVCAGDRCIPQEALAACAAADDGQACTTTHISAGVCFKGECRVSGCGNGFVERDEVCDDGNVADGDACSAQCDEVDICPPIGTTPHYSSKVHELFFRDCSEYNEAADRDVAIALCDNGLSVNQGPKGGPLTQIPGITSPDLKYLHAYLAPEGDRIYVNYYGGPNGFQYEEHARGDGDFTSVKVITSEDDNTATLYSVGPPTRGPSPHIMQTNALGLIELEIDEDNAIARIVRISDFTSLGFPGYGYVRSLSPDGLRAVFEGDNGFYFSDRPSLDTSFRPAEPLNLLPITGYNRDVYMTANCGRIYFSAIGYVFYVQQR